MSYPDVQKTIEVWLLSYLSKRLGIPAEDIDPNQVFTVYGLASVEALQLMSDLGQWLGSALSPILAWNYPTIQQLAQHLAGDASIQQKARALSDIPQTVQTATYNNEPIAIVGMSCRFPGAEGAPEFWQLLCAGREAITETPFFRWDTNALYSPDPATPGKTIGRWGGFLKDIDRFDAQFFGISPREAPHMDPRQRVMLEITWEAVEDAGIAIDSLAGSNTGVFVATLSDDYDQLLYSDLNRVDAYSGAGTANSIVANRISYLFDFHGPSLSLDTACSGSLVAIHLACQSLRQGDCSAAIAGGVSINLLPKGQVFFSKAGALATDGRCKTFSSQANGIVRSEGAGAVLLKPLARAQADGDRIYAVIMGSAVNQDGRSNGLMAPNGQAQEAVLREAYQKAGVSPSQVQYIEAHGTGTRLGDPIEVQALGAVLAADRRPGQLCALGSLKTNVGHMEPAAGVAGVIKTAMSIYHRQLPPSLHCTETNPLISFDQLPFKVQQELGGWPDDSRQLIAGVSGFGFGGTNAHVVLAEPPTVRAGAPAAGYASLVEQRPAARMLPLSARSEDALREMAARLRDLLNSEDFHASLEDIAYTASLKRNHHANHRLAVVAGSKEEAVERLDAFAGGVKASTGIVSGIPAGGQPHKLVFVFSGQGSHWAKMGCQLYQQEEVFRETLNECDRLLRQYVPWSLIDELERDAENTRLNETNRTQPAIFAVQVALAALWRSWGIEPQAIVGQSLGEIAAAHVAGVLSLDEALRVVIHRSRLMKRTEGKGKTAVVGLPLAQAQAAIAEYSNCLAVAGSNSPNSSVLSGAPEAIDAVLAAMEKKGVFCRALEGVSVAFHSPQMEPLKTELIDALGDLRPRASYAPLYSTVTGGRIDGKSMGAAYWARNLRDPFLFAATIERLLGEGYDAFLEVGPHPVLCRSIQDVLAHTGKQGTVWASLKRGEAQYATLLSTLGAMYVAGYPLDWRRFFPTGGKMVELPAYPWQRERYWYDQLDQGLSPALLLGGKAKKSTHPLLGDPVQMASAPHAVVFESEINARSLHYLKDHRVQGTLVLSGSMFGEMALSASEQVWDQSRPVVEDLRFKQPLILPETGARLLQLVITPLTAHEAAFEFASRDPGSKGDWVEHAQGKLWTTNEHNTPLREPLEDIRARCLEDVPGSQHYARMAERGLPYGSAYQWIRQIWRRDGEALVAVEAPASLRTELGLYAIHPALLDNGFQAAAQAFGLGEQFAEDAYLPVGATQLRVFGPAAGAAWCHVRRRESAQPGDATRLADVTFLDADGQPLAEVGGLVLQRMTAQQRSTPREGVYNITWQAFELPGQQPDLTGNWLILPDRNGLAQKLASQIDRLGGQGHVITDGALQEQLSRLGNCRGVIDLSALDLPAADDMQLVDGTKAGCLALLSLIQKLAAGHAAPRLWLVTRGAQPLPGDPRPVALSQSPLLGMARVAAQEFPNLWGGTVDLGDDSDETLDALAVLLAQNGQENTFALRSEDAHCRCFVPRLIQLEQAAEQGLNIRLSASYLITGGMGGLGLAVAEWLAARGARRLILLGRTPLPPRSQWAGVDPQNPLAERVTAIQRIEALGAAVYTSAVDVSDARQLSCLLDDLDRLGWPPVQGIIHAAGVLEDHLIYQMTPQHLDRVLGPKVAGSWALHQAFAEQPLDFFILFSSAASILGQVGQANYAAGNAFMDALAHYRRAQGLPATSINWGVWGEVGMAARLNLQDHFQHSGMYAFTPESALKRMDHLVGSGAAQAAVIAAEWPKLQRAANSLHTFLEELCREPGRAVADQSGKAGHSLPERLLMAGDTAERRVLVECFLRELIAQVLGFGDPNRMPVDKSLTTLGFDSIMALEIKNRIEANLPVRLSVADLVVGPSVAQLTDAIQTQLTDSLAVDQEVLDLLDEIEDLSEEDLAALLDEGEDAAPAQA